MAINKDDVEMAKWVLDQAIYQGTPLDLRDAILIRAFFSALEEHEERPTENVRSREWRAMVYRKLLEDPAALQQFTEEALRKFSPEEISTMLHPLVHQAVITRYAAQQPSVEEISLEDVIANTPGRELFKLLSEEGRIPDIVDYILDHNPEYVKEYFGWSDAEDVDAEKDASYNDGYSTGYDEGHNRGFEQGLDAQD